jgi:NAD(P)-dependent dehydrogenase (short-subunit alcohol dehydrogenase family)
MEISLAGKVALVTGAGTGIGHGVALALAEAGADVAATFHSNAAGGQQLAGEVAALGRRYLPLPADLSQPEACHDVIARTLGEYGQLDMLVNNAGVTWPKPFLELDKETWDATFAINLTAMFLCSQGAARAMVAAGRGGRIINMSSVHSAGSYPGHAHYEATKGGINSFTRGLAIELAPHGITANVVAPGAIEVPRYFDRPGYDRDEMGSRIPLGRVGLPRDIGPLCAFLASEAASYITGAVIFVDGGMTSRLAL